MTRPLLDMFKRPLSAILAITGVVGVVLFVKVTLDAMLGLSDSVMFDPGY